MAKFLRMVFLIILILLISPLISVAILFIGNAVVFFLTNYVLFPVEEKYLFTYDKHFDCLKEGEKDPRIKKICEAMEEIKAEIKKPAVAERLGMFNKSFVRFARGEKKTRFYYSKNLAGSDRNLPNGGKINSFKDRLMLYFFQKSVYKSWAYSVLFYDKIVVGDEFLNSPPNWRTRTMVHEILHLCWATEWEVDLLSWP